MQALGGVDSAENDVSNWPNESGPVAYGADRGSEGGSRQPYAQPMLIRGFLRAP